MDHHRLLMADRNTEFMEKAERILSEEGIQLVTATNGSRVLSLCQQDLPDGALLHVDLPGLPGNELCQRLKTQVDASLPVVLMFAEGTEGAAGIASGCRADNYLIRPVKRTELLFCVRAMLQLRHLLREARAAATASSSGGPSGMVALDVFHTFVDIELRRVDRYGFPLSLLDVAVDPLPEDVGAWSKALDDQLGPALASAIRSSLRDIDVSTVITRRELLVLLPHTDEEGAVLVAKRICRTIAAQAYHFGRARIQPTVSIGVATLHGERSTLEQILARVAANRARAAEGGGNRVHAG